MNHKTPRPTALQQGEIEYLSWLAEHPHAPIEERGLAKITANVIRCLFQMPGALGDGARRQLVKSLKAKGIRCCRVCGCTDDYACPGGCGWSQDPEICDRCVR